MFLEGHMWGSQRAGGPSCCSSAQFPDAHLPSVAVCMLQAVAGETRPQIRASLEAPSPRVQPREGSQQGQPGGSQQGLSCPFRVCLWLHLCGVVPSTRVDGSFHFPRQPITLSGQGRACSQPCTRPLGQTRGLRVNRLERKPLFGV